MCCDKSQIVVLITKHINMNESIHDKIAHQQLKIPLLTVENITESLLWTDLLMPLSRRLEKIWGLKWAL